MCIMGSRARSGSRTLQHVWPLSAMVNTHLPATSCVMVVPHPSLQRALHTSSPVYSANEFNTCSCHQTCPVQDTHQPGRLSGVGMRPGRECNCAVHNTEARMTRANPASPTIATALDICDARICCRQATLRLGMRICRLLHPCRCLLGWMCCVLARWPGMYGSSPSASSPDSRRTLSHVFSFGHDELKAANFQQDAMDRACPKELRAPPLLIGVAGGTASGKTTVCENIAKAMADDRVVIISMDNFYRPLTDEEKENVNGMHSSMQPQAVQHAMGVTYRRDCSSTFS